MSTFIYDRIAGKPADASPNPPLGRFQIFPSDKDVFLNSIPVNLADYLVPDGAFTWDLVAAQGEERVGGSFLRAQIPAGLDIEGILALSDRLNAMMERGATAFDWLCESPLIPGISERATRQALDRAISERLGSLEDVCRGPRSHLRAEIERLPVSKARRIPATAFAYLAAHTEDWERPTVRSVKPKRVLAMIQDDEWNIYENRVTARLVDHLRAYLRRREEELRRLAKLFDDASDHSSTVATGTHWRRTRISRLWGEAVKGNDGYRLVKSTLDEVERLRYRVSGLMESPLYRQVPRNAAVPAALNQTNIFSSDTRYRRVASLWQIWASRAGAEQKSSREVYNDYQRLCRGFADFCLLLTLRAFDQLGYHPSDSEARVRRGSRLELKSREGGADLILTEDGVLSVGGGAPLRVVPLPAMLYTSPDPDELQRQLNEMEVAAPEGALTLVLFPSPSMSVAPRVRNEQRRWLHSLGNDGIGRQGRKLGFLPVSPWDLGSVERVCRALRWALTSPRFRAYPPEITPPPRDLDRAALVGTLEAHGAQRFYVVRPPEEKVKRGAQRLLNALRSEREQREMRMEELKQGKPRDDRRALKEWNVQKQRLQQDLSSTRERLEEVERFERCVGDAERQLDTLLGCPVCAERLNPDHGFNARSDRTFHCVCAGCGARWGTEICRQCQSRYPYLQSRGATMQAARSDPGWVDDTLGCDVLAVPCEHGYFICTECGECSCSKTERPVTSDRRTNVPLPNRSR